MILRGRQGRFLVTTLALWTALRLAQSWPHGGAPAEAADEPAAAPVTASPSPPRPAAAGERTAPPRAKAAALTIAVPDPSGGRGIDARARFPDAGAGARVASPGSRVAAIPAAPPAPHGVAPAVPSSVPPLPPSPAPPAPPAPRRLAVEAYLFARPGSGRAALSPDGQLGGSQAAVRATYRVGRVGPVGVAAVARAYAPLAARGAEAAVGLDLAPLPGRPFRLSIERRQRLDGAGRSAWSAYAAGGFYAERRGIVLDGYAQAGVVGARARDGFVDGALRAGIRTGRAGPILGAGAWGAAQPGVARLDVGPRAAIRLPLAGHALDIAVEGRFRLAGRAAPGSGAALTVAAAL